MVWREPNNHVTDCYFYLTDVKRLSSTSKHCIWYSILHPAMRPVPHSEDLRIPTSVDKYTFDSEKTPLMIQKIKMLNFNHLYIYDIFTS